jgi:hypothetical protein
VAKKDVLNRIQAAMTHGFDPIDIALAIDTFARHVGNGIEPRDSMMKAFGLKETAPAELHRAAMELLEMPQVTKLVDEYKAENKSKADAKRAAAESVTYDIGRAMTDARLAYDTACERGNASAMVAASQLMAKLHGLLVDKQEVKHGPLKGLSDDELDSEIAKYAAISVIDKAKNGPETTTSTSTS